MAILHKIELPARDRDVTIFSPKVAQGDRQQSHSRLEILLMSTLQAAGPPM